LRIIIIIIITIADIAYRPALDYLPIYVLFSGARRRRGIARRSRPRAPARFASGRCRARA
jgi:hypothetical protein